MSPETNAEALPPQPEIVCACPPSHRRLRFTMFLFVAILAISLVACLIYLGVTGGLKP